MGEWPYWDNDGNPVEGPVNRGVNRGVFLGTNRINSPKMLDHTKIMPYKGRYAELVSVEYLTEDEYRIEERNPVHMSRIIWVNKETKVIMFEIGDTNA